jgi:hypothetical protein
MPAELITAQYGDKTITTGRSGERIILQTAGLQFNDNITITAAKIESNVKKYDKKLVIE